MEKKMKFETADLTEMNIEKLEKLFPNCISEKKDESGQLIKAVNFEVFKQIFSKELLEDGDEAYEFTWVGKREAIVEANKPIRKTLRPCLEESKDWDKTENLYIEGDNLDVLKTLQESYLNSVKMIYIDPPYNTGNDFIYNDDFKMTSEEYREESGELDEEGNRLFKNTDSNGRFHSDWCSMIYSRLVLARNLLSDDGVIFINMDENEIINLQKICFEVFGELNELGTIVWDKRNPKGDAKGISEQHEYIVCYCKNKSLFLNENTIKRPKKSAKQILDKAKSLYNRINKNYSLEDANKEFSKWINAQKGMSGGEKAYNKIDEKGNVYQPVSMAWPNKKDAPKEYFIPLIHPITKKECPVPSRGWRNPPNTMKNLIEKGLVLFGEDEKTQPRRKYLLVENMYENIPSLLYFGGSDTDLLEELNIPFDTPKVVEIYKEHIQAFTDEDSIILDFFSGSATTAHAVMDLNAEDGGKRKFIMVQLPEETDKKSEAYKAGYKNICEIGKERIRRAGEKIKADNKDKAGIENLDIGFRVLKLDESNMKDVYYTPEEYGQQSLEMQESNIKEDRTDLDLLFACLLEWGLPLEKAYESLYIEDKEVHIYNHGDLLACFEERISESLVKEIAKMRPLRVVFRDSCFESDSNKINIEEIFKLLSPETSVKVI